MKISFSPVRMDSTLEVAKAGDTLTINGTAFDFSVIPEGATLPAAAVPSEFVVGDVSRDDGELSLTLLLPYGPVPLGYHFEPEALVDPADGVLALPAPPVQESPVEPVIEEPEPVVEEEPVTEEEPAVEEETPATTEQESTEVTDEQP